MKLFAVHPMFQMRSYERYCDQCRHNLNTAIESPLFGTMVLCDKEPCEYSAHDSPWHTFKYRTKNVEANVHLRQLIGTFGIDVDYMKEKLLQGLHHVETNKDEC